MIIQNERVPFDYLKFINYFIHLNNVFSLLNTNIYIFVNLICGDANFTNIFKFVEDDGFRLLNQITRKNFSQENKSEVDSSQLFIH